jgi:DNA repair ATPase RecN
MAKTQQKDILTQFRDLGSEALHKLADVPGGSKLMEMANESRSRLDEIQKKLRGLDALEKRVAKLERQLADQAKKTATTARKTAAAGRAKTPKKPPV